MYACRVGGLEGNVVDVELNWAALPDGSLAAVGRFRFALREPTLHPWGHLGMDVLPSARSRRVATEFLVQMIREAWAFGLKELVVTAHEANDHSIRLIHRCGGRSLHSVRVHPDGERYLHFAFEKPD